MKFSYDPRYNIAYISFHDKPGQVKTMQISDELNIDIADDGTVYGLELLNANKQLQAAPDNQFLIVNEATGKKIQVPLSLSV